MIKIIIVDDHELFRLGIKKIIEKHHPDIKIVGDVSTGFNFFELLKTVSADIILLDILLPDISGIDIVKRLKVEYPDLKILAVSADNSAYTIKKMLNLGINGFITKRQGSIDSLIDGIKSIMNGNDFFGKDISEIIHRIYITKKKTTDTTSEFTNQEKRIIDLCHKGLLAKEIADHLKISSRTVEKHKEKIFKKLGINNTLEMIQYAVKMGIIRMEW